MDSVVKKNSKASATCELITLASKISKPEDIAKLPWKGNYYQDQKLFKAIDQYILKEKDKNKQKKALYLMGLHGMGDRSKVTDKDLAEYLEEMKAFRKW